MSWFDCTSGRRALGLLMRARPAAGYPGREWHERQRTVPFTPPFSFVNRLTLGPLNSAYYRLGRLHRGRRIVHYRPFLFPLDALHDWNRLYGPRGFYQYQCVVPPASGPQAVAEMLDAVAISREGSVLAVLKTFGDRQAPGMMSFVHPGVTLALDFRNAKGAEPLFQRLDAIVREAGGRVYLAKDSRMPKAMFEATYPRLGEFRRYRDPGMSSALSRRLMDG